IVYQHDIKTDFPEEVRLQSEAIPDTVLESDKLGRKDLTDQDVVTIDGDDSKDFDDAVNVKKLANGNYYLGVHIADVSYYVTEGSPLDVEALERGTSTYLTDRVIPMLPFRLSNGICSLNPDVERLALTCEMEINEHGVVVDHKIFPSVIKSTARMTYKNVNKILTDQDADLRAQYERLVPMFETMSELHEILLKKRHNRGAIDFEEDEAKIIVDENGKAIDIELRQRGLSERMIESFMLAANETVAEHYSTANAPFLYRIHETPDADKMKNFFEFITAYGIQAHGSSKKVTPMMLQEVLTQIEGQPEQPIITTMLLRSMQQAHYSDESLGHFGLGAEFYTHFTSPIRRYPDLMVHRLIHSYATNGMTIEEKEKWAPKLQPIAEQTSLEERRSIDTEREVVDLKKAEYMLDKVGNEYDAVISSVTSFGMFIALPSTVEGLVHISQMKDDYYSFVESQLALVGERTHKMFRIGQPVRVKVANVDLDAHSVDFELLAGEEVPLASAEILSKIEARPKRPARPRDHEKGGQRRGDQKKNNHPRRPAANKDSQKRTFKK
ncbi:MAG: ribonuclease R, partial [Latilactobacillus curvatus]|nr:ribonuclease R [Latilactobacillus curvatus]